MRQFKNIIQLSNKNIKKNKWKNYAITIKV